MIRLQGFKSDGLDFCEGDTLMTDVAVWPQSVVVFSMTRLTWKHDRVHFKNQIGSGWGHACS